MLNCENSWWIGSQVGQLVLAAVLGIALAGCGSDASASAPTSGVGQPHSGSTPPPSGSTPTTPTSGGTNVSLGGSQDTGFLRGQLEDGLVPTPQALDAAGFFAEHYIELPPASCGKRVCLQPMLAVMGNLMDGSNCTMLHLGLNSPLAADPGARPPLSLSVVIDVSGSMQGEKIELVRDGLELLVDGMKDGDELSLVTYSDFADVVAPLQAVDGRRAELRRTIQGLQAAGSTNLAEGLETGYREILAGYDSSRQNRVILLSDGQPTAGITGQSSILSLSRAYNSDGIGLTTIGLGADFNIELMRSLALQADGNFYFLEDVGAVNEVFEEELSFFVVPVAFDLELEVTSGPAYDFGRALGTPFWTDSPSGGRLDVPSVFLAHRESDDDVTEDDGRRGGGSSLLLELMPQPDLAGEAGSTVATLELSYRDPESQETVKDEVTLAYPYPPNELRRQGFFQAESLTSVQKSFVMLNIYVGIERAVVAYHSNQASRQTLADLDHLIAAVTDYNDEVADTDIELDLELLDMLRANLIRAGVPVETIAPVSDPWPAD